MKLKKHMLALGVMSALGTSAFAQTPISADITANTTWTTAGNPYILQSNIYVKNGAILDIAPGVIIRGQPRTTTLETAGALIVARGSKIQARGTAAAPIIFTTAALNNLSRWVSGTGLPFLDPNPASAPLPPLMDLDNDGAADDKVMRFWGGVVICGNARTNSLQDVNGDSVADPGQGLVEGLTDSDAVYGGTVDDDDSGIMQFVSIRHGGDGIIANKEINALTLYSVGSKTTVSYVDAYCNSDDGVEVFGGAVNLDHLNLNYCDDDGFDTDEGYRGTAEFIFVLQGLGYGDKGMELDGDDYDEASTGATSVNPLFPVPDVQIRNATVIARAGSTAIHMRNGFNGSLINSIIWKEGTAADTGMLVENVGTGDLAPSPAHYFDDGSLQIRSVTAWNFTTYYNVSAIAGGVEISGAGAVTGSFEGVAIPSVYYPATNNRGSASASFNPDFSITHGTLIDAIPAGPAGAIGFVQDLAYVRDPGTFASYRGAFDPARAAQWTFGWTALHIAGKLAN